VVDRPFGQLAEQSAQFLGVGEVLSQLGRALLGLGLTLLEEAGCGRAVSVRRPVGGQDVERVEQVPHLGQRESQRLHPADHQ
jgi:hypothetical protein